MIPFKYYMLLHEKLPTAENSNTYYFLSPVVSMNTHLSLAITYERTLPEDIVSWAGATKHRALGVIAP